MFASWSGQLINHQKSFLHFSNNMAPADKDSLASMLRLNCSTHGGNYLGLPLCIPGSIRSHACKDLKEKVTKCIAGWKAKTLSQAGHTVMIQTVAATLPTYFMAVLLMFDLKTSGGGLIMIINIIFTLRHGVLFALRKSVAGLDYVMWLI